MNLQLDAKKSPLALLAQTCSQIGADTAAIKPSSGSLDKNKKSETSKSPSTISKTPKSNTSPQETRPLAFKPYELNVLTRSNDDRPSSKSSSTNGSVCDEKYKQNNMNSNSARVPSRNKTNSSPELSAVNNRDSKSETGSAGKSTPNALDRKSTSPDRLSQRGASPIVRSGLEVLHGHSSNGAFKANAFGMNPLAALCCPPGMEQHANPAFRPPFANGFAHHHAAMLAAAAAGYSGAQGPQNPYISYQRVKTPSGSETVVPVCKDPYCTGCQFSQHNQQMMLGVPCPSGCTQCEHQKYGLAMAMSGLQANNPYSQLDRPYLCSWIVGDSYCGKRCATSEELLQHLRTHTPNLSDPAATAVLVQAQQRAMASMHPLNSLFSPSSLAAQRYEAFCAPKKVEKFGAQNGSYGYPAPLSPLSAARYHPYGKPSPSSAIPSTLPGSPYATFNPAALNPYYSPYAMYSQRLGAAAAAAAAAAHQ